jgi:tetratricopeptide (TPR) repeat protein
MKLGSAALALALASAPALALGDTPPTVWDLGKNPDAFAQRRQHLAIENDIETAEELTGDPRLIAGADTARAEDEALMLVQSWQGPQDRWLRFDEAWVAMRRKDYTRALPILERLAKEEGRSYFSQEVWQKLAECYVRLERTSDEIHAYDEVLSRAMSDVQRLTPMLNRGEAIMRAGDADAALAQFRELETLAARIPNAVELSLLADWDIAVALDRSGDFRTALDKARATLQTTKAALLLISPVNTSVYFVPDYEREWYLALGYAALALESSTPREIAEAWRSSESAMTTYVNKATIHGKDHWLALARRRLDEIRKRRAEADKHAPPPSDETTF